VAKIKLMQTPLVVPPTSPSVELGEYEEIGEYAESETEADSVGTFVDKSNQQHRFLSDENGDIPTISRSQWVQDASDEMLFHWLCTSRFNSKTLHDQRNSCIVKYNPFYWMVFIVTYLSLGLGREFHILIGQGDPVSDTERRSEYEVRVHWVYCTTGAMLWVCVRSIFTILMWMCGIDDLDWLAVAVTWTLVMFYCAGNAVFLRMMHRRNLVGTRSIIVCNAVFSLCMLGSLITFGISVRNHFDDYDTVDAISNLYVLFEKSVAVVFFLMATAIYMKLWSLYRFNGRNFKRRMLETIPAILSALVMLVLMYLALFYDQHEFQPYVWATFI
jgi:hypothetical protein